MNNVPTLYLAGKISKPDWRFGPVPALDRDYPEPLDTPIHCSRFIYVGPFFIGCDHACGHGPSTHGVAKNSCTYHVAPPRWKVRRSAGNGSCGPTSLLRGLMIRPVTGRSWR